jgi:hypothetical protein
MRIWKPTPSIWPCLLLSLVCALPAAAQDPAGDWDRHLAGIRSRAEAVQQALPEIAYTAESESQQLDSHGTAQKVIRSVRQVRFTWPDQYQQEYSFMSINGQELSAEKRNAELSRMRGQRGESPFLPGEMPKYRFTREGETEYEGHKVWKVGFQPLEPGEKLAQGFGYILPETYDVVYFAFSPSRLPTGLQAMKAEMRYQPIQDYWLPSEFHMELHVKVSFLITLADLRVLVEEKYSDYQGSLSKKK